MLAQSPEPEAHDKVLENYPDRIGLLEMLLFEEKDNIKNSKFTKFGYVSLRGNQAVICQRLSQFHTNVSNSEMAFPKSIKSLFFPRFLKTFYMVAI